MLIFKENASLNINFLIYNWDTLSFCSEELLWDTGKIPFAECLVRVLA